MTRHTLPGSERHAVADARRIAAADPSQRMEAVLILRRGDTAALDALIARLDAGERIEPPLTREAYAARFGAHANDFAAVAAFARDYRLTVVRADAARRMVVLAGTVERMQAAFEVQFHRYEEGKAPSTGARPEQFRARVGTITLPDTLHGVVTAVLGLDDRRQARTHFRVYRPRAGAEPAVSYTPPQVAALYQFPPGDGSGQCIGLIELGGGYRSTDLTSYFGQLDIAPPTVVAVSVDGGSNQPGGGADGPDGEVLLDIEVAGAIAPGAEIAVYFANNTDAGFIDAVSQAVHDTVNRPSVVSISWGGPESSWTAQSMQSFNEVLQEAAVLGVTVCVAAGDGGASDGTTGSQGKASLEVDFPASSPYVLACGGTSLRGSGTTIASETVWNDGAQGGATGGGVSTEFALPSWQQGLQATNLQGQRMPLNGRGVPDVAGNADPETGYAVRVDGTQTVVGGTSAVAPLWAALIARINAQQGKPLGYLNPTLYKQAAALRDITQGNNGGYEASAGWDACTGLGSPDGARLVGAI